MSFLVEGLLRVIASIISGVLGYFADALTACLSLDPTIFMTYFSFLKPFRTIFVVIGAFLAVTIGIVKIFQSLYRPAAGIKSEAAPVIAARMVIAVLLVMLTPEISGQIVKAGQNFIANTQVKVGTEEYTAFKGGKEVLSGSKVWEGMTFFNDVLLKEKDDTKDKNGNTVLTKKKMNAEKFKLKALQSNPSIPTGNPEQTPEFRQAVEIEKQIDALPDEITENDRDAVIKAADEYNNASDLGRTYVTQQKREKLQAALDTINGTEGSEDAGEAGSAEEAAPENGETQSVTETLGNAVSGTADVLISILLMLLVGFSYITFLLEIVERYAFIVFFAFLLPVATGFAASGETDQTAKKGWTMFLSTIFVYLLDLMLLNAIAFGLANMVNATKQLMATPEYSNVSIVFGVVIIFAMINIAKKIDSTINQIVPTYMTDLEREIIAANSTFNLVRSSVSNTISGAREAAAAAGKLGGGARRSITAGRMQRAVDSISAAESGKAGKITAPEAVGAAAGSLKNLSRADAARINGAKLLKFKTGLENEMNRITRFRKMPDIDRNSPEYADLAAMSSKELREYRNKVRSALNSVEMSLGDQREALGSEISKNALKGAKAGEKTFMFETGAQPRAGKIPVAEDTADTQKASLNTQNVSSQGENVKENVPVQEDSGIDPAGSPAGAGPETPAGNPAGAGPETPAGNPAGAGQKFQDPLRLNTNDMPSEEMESLEDEFAAYQQRRQTGGAPRNTRVYDEPPLTAEEVSGDPFDSPSEQELESVFEPVKSDEGRVRKAGLFRRMHKRGER